MIAEKIPELLNEVLIDTWWNVNLKIVDSITNNDQRFNRYMVECEWFPYMMLADTDLCFNRYMVECEL